MAVTWKTPLTPRKPCAAEMTHIPSSNLCQPSWGGKHFQIWRKYEDGIGGQYQFGLLLAWNAILCEPVTPRSQFCGAYLSLGIIMMIVETFHIVFGWVLPKMGDSVSLLLYLREYSLKKERKKRKNERPQKYRNVQEMQNKVNINIIHSLLTRKAGPD